MGIYAEALILYILIFFSGSSVISASGDFSSIAEITKLLVRVIPSLALIWYLIHKSTLTNLNLIRGKYILASSLDVRFKKKDLISAAYAYPCLLAAGFAVTSASALSGTAISVTVQMPSSQPQWLVLCVSCLLSAYLEESYFRFYLLSKRDEMNMNAFGALILSVILFSVCHIYGGPWTFLNAVISGTFLGFIFLKYNAIHGLAIAHGLYNISVYVINAVFN